MLATQDKNIQSAAEKDAEIAALKAELQKYRSSN